MAFIDWKESYALGIKKIDEQHHNLLETMNELFKMFLEKELTDDNFQEVFGKLSEYSHIHFQTEETYFVQADYEKRSVHAAIHDQMRRQVTEIAARYEKPGTDRERLFFELSEFLYNVWIWHINSFDREYVPCLKAHNIS